MRTSASACRASRGVLPGTQRFVASLEGALQTKGADMKASGTDGFTPLLAAAFTGNAEIMRWLIGEGADVNGADKQGRTPLMGAAVRGLADMVKELVAKGANVAAKDKDGRNAIGYATLAGEQDVVAYLKGLP